ncbi:MAG: GTPase Era [Chitinophagaceae bacterium]|jgi:GTP-binding protein Era|nr:GTPase Era [Chitinophagaceae bacterium]
MQTVFQSGFVSLFGKPNAGKSTLLNALVGEKMAIVSHKVQTTRHRIKAFLNHEHYQIIFSDTPGIIEPKYKLHQKMMQQVKNALEDTDLALLLYDLTDKDLEAADQLFASLKLKVPAIVLCNKVDAVSEEAVKEALSFFSEKTYAREVLPVSALQKEGLGELLKIVLKYLPEGMPFYDEEDLSDLPTKFFVGELIREKIFELYHEEIPYQATVLVQEFKEKSTLVKVQADIIVHRETQKFIIIGEKGKMIKQLGTEARKAIEEFIGQKVFLELFVKVRPKWRDDELKLREYGY